MKVSQMIIALIFFTLSPFQNIFAEAVPIRNPLSMEQRTLYMQASPSGQDKQIINPAVTQLISSDESSMTTPSIIEKKVATKLSPISLEEKIQKQVVQPKLEQFGYDLFKQVPTTFSPVTNIPIPSDYIIGPGDTLIAQLFGKTNVEYKLIVTREGHVLIPDFGPVLVSGLTFSEVKQSLKSRFEKQMFGVNAAITLSELRTINIMIVGDVNNPGSYTISGLSNLMNALLVSGGVKRTGSLRNIQLKRNGKVISSFDLYQVLLKGNTKANTRLTHGDVIFVPAIGATVGIGGEVQRPAIYELENERSFNKIIQLAGGLLPSASLDSSHIERIKENNFHTLISLKQSANALNQLVIHAGDLIRIFPVQKRIDDVVLLSGHIIQPGGYEFKPNMRLSHLISSYNQLRQNVDTQVALLRRELPNQRKIETRYIDLSSVIHSPLSNKDIKLKARDEIIFFDLSKNRSMQLANIVQDLRIQSTLNYPPMVFSIKGHIKNSGTFPLQYASRLLDVLKISGDIKTGTDREYVVIARKQYPGNKIDLFSLDLNLAEQKPLSEYNPIIHPEDTIYIFNNTLNRTALLKSNLEQLKKQTEYGQKTPIVTISGRVKHQGDFPLEPGMRLEKLLKAAGGMNENAYGIRAELTRYELIDGEYQISKQQQIDISDIKFSKMILHPGDHLTILSKPNKQPKRSVSILGEVRFPGNYPLNRNETLCSVLKRVGGLTDSAYSFGAVFTRQSVKKKQQQSLNKVQGELDDLLVKLHLSPSVKNDEKMPSNEEMHEVDKVIRKLKKAKASGRMVVDIDKISRCDKSKDILLENGDQLYIPKLAYEVSVFGEVYHSSTHQYDSDKGSQEYINLSGGVTVLGNNSHAYVVQANGEVETVRSSSNWFSQFNSIAVKPGASIYVPINVDRSNNRENIQSWATILFRLTLSAAGIAAIL